MTGCYYLLDFEEFAIFVAQFNLSQHSLTLFRNELLELIANCFEMLWLLLVQFVKQFHLLVLFILDEVFESVSFSEQLSLRLHQHLPPERLQHFFSDFPIKNVHHSCLLLCIKLISFLEIVYEVGLIDDLVTLCLVEYPRLLDQLFVKVDSWEESVVGKLALAQLNVNLHNIA